MVGFGKGDRVLQQVEDGDFQRVETLSLQHLEAELARIDVRIGRAVHCWQLAGQDPSDVFRGLHVSGVEAGTLLERPLGAGWGHGATLKPGEARALARAEDRATHQAQSLAEAARRQGKVVRLERLASAFGLDRFDLDALLICLAPALDLRYERIYGYLQDDVTRRWPRVNLVLDLLCEPGLGRVALTARFAEDAPLLRHQILRRASEPGLAHPPLLSQALRVDESIVAWLLGRYQPHAGLGGHATLVRAEGDGTEWLLAAERCNGLLTRIAPSDECEAPVVLFHGVDLVSQRAAGRMLAAQAGRALLEVDLEGVITDVSAPRHAVRLALRDARLTGAVPFLAGWDACLAQDGALPPELLAQLCAHPGLVVVAGRAAWQPAGVERTRPFFRVEFPVPGYEERLWLWKYYVQIGEPASGRIEQSTNVRMYECTNERMDKCTNGRMDEWTDGWTDGWADGRMDGCGGGRTGECAEVETLDLTSLAGQFGLTAGQIRDAVATARDRAVLRGEGVRGEDLFAAARAHSSPRLASLARKIEPRYTWDDIVLPDDQLAMLKEIVATVRGRPVVLDQWRVGHKLASSAGVTVLFAGPPGTGKTMAAEVIAAELGLDLYKIDLSTIVSKYIGETEKNLERIFQEAESSNSILFFDEADAIFGKRSEVKDAHDRYANIEISYLLQRMEMYDGVTVLATNLRANLDEAFTRRLQFAVDFPFPEEDYRVRIWETLFPADVPCEPGIDFGLLAGRFKLAGGSIRNVIVSATYLAAANGQRVTMAHLLHGTRRELQKMGRLVNEADMRMESKQ